MPTASLYPVETRHAASLQTGKNKPPHGLAVRGLGVGVGAGGTPAVHFAGGTPAVHFAGGTPAVHFAGGTPAVHFAGGTPAPQGAETQHAASLH